MLALVMLISSVPMASAATKTFEQQLKSFPESYKPYLRTLHKKHPKWVFEAFDTGLNWDYAVDSEHAGNKSLVIASSSYTDLFKSVASGDYDPSSGYYYQKDAGFCRANRLAVAYYMDPRNFLNSEEIFQFEYLASNPMIQTLEGVERILDGTFMSRTYVVKPTLYIHDGFVTGIEPETKKEDFFGFA